MTERQIQDILSVNYMSNPEFKIPGLYIYYWESDLILVMDGGQVVEQGTHEQLLDKNGFYRRLYDSQFAARQR